MTWKMRWLVYIVSIAAAELVSCDGRGCSCAGGYECSYETKTSQCHCEFNQTITIGLVIGIFILGVFWYARAYNQRQRKHKILRSKSIAKILELGAGGRGSRSVNINPASKWNTKTPPSNFNSIMPQDDNQST